MATENPSYETNRSLSSLLVNLVLIMICLVWIVPTIGVLVTSFREQRGYFTDGLVDDFSASGWIETQRD